MFDATAATTNGKGLNAFFVDWTTSAGGAVGNRTRRETNEDATGFHGSHGAHHFVSRHGSNLTIAMRSSCVAPGEGSGVVVVFRCRWRRITAQWWSEVRARTRPSERRGADKLTKKTALFELAYLYSDESGRCAERGQRFGISAARLRFIWGLCPVQPTLGIRLPPVVLGTSLRHSKINRAQFVQSFELGIDFRMFHHCAQQKKYFSQLPIGLPSCRVIVYDHRHRYRCSRMRKFGWLQSERVVGFVGGNCKRQNEFLISDNS